jgi:ATPase subunit of ABC transporter with duplicated ATPase domains
VSASFSRPAVQQQPAATLATREIDRSRSLLEVASLSKNFGGVRPANDVTFRLQPAYVHALIGPNGARKSTLINMISGGLTPSSGRIAFLAANLISFSHNDRAQARSRSGWHRPPISALAPYRSSAPSTNHPNLATNFQAVPWLR